MKHSLKFVFFLLTLTISLFTISCSSDDDSGEANEQLVGNSTSATGQFSNWSSTWDFGTSSDYPGLTINGEVSRPQ